MLYKPVYKYVNGNWLKTCISYSTVTKTKVFYWEAPDLKRMWASDYKIDRWGNPV